MLNDRFFEIYKTGERISLKQAEALPDFPPTLYVAMGDDVLTNLEYCFPLLEYLERFGWIDSWKYIGKPLKKLVSKKGVNY